MTEIWMGYTTISRATEEGRLVPTGNKRLAADLRSWLKLGPFAEPEKLVA